MIQKNNYFKKQRHTEIIRENQILTNKLKKIDSCSYTQNFKANPPKKSKKTKFSLNNEKRKKEMMRITIENISLMRRITSMKSFYNPRSMTINNSKHIELVELHCEYPLILEKKERGQDSKYNSSSVHPQSSV